MEQPWGLHWDLYWLMCLCAIQKENGQVSVPRNLKPIYYRRYVDDSFVIFKSREQVEPFLRYLNSRHKNIKFTFEVEQNGVLPFLDIRVRRAQSFHTSVYRKPTFTGLYTNFSSFIPYKYKVNLVKSLLFRSYKICSNMTVQHKF